MWKPKIMSNIKEHKCLICNSIFLHKRSLKSHEDCIHKAIQVSCQECGKKYRSRSGLNDNDNVYLS